MCSPICRRMSESCSPLPATGRRGGSGAGGRLLPVRRLRCAARASASPSVAALDEARATSFFVTRPRRPVPSTCSRRSRARRRSGAPPGETARLVASASAGCAAAGWVLLVGDAPRPAGRRVSMRGEQRAHVHRLALLDEDLLHPPGGRARASRSPPCRWRSRRRLVALDPVARALAPRGDGALGHGDAHLGHGDLHQRGVSRRGAHGTPPSRRRPAAAPRARAAG